MIFAILYYIFTTIAITTLSVIVLSTTFFLCVKLFFENTKSVCKSNVRLDKKIVLITGGNSGIGLETARELASRGATVIIACEEPECTEVVTDMIKTTGNKNIHYKYLDLAKFSSIRNFVEDFNTSYDRLDILINNAGCYGLETKTTEDGNEILMQINYLGPFLLTNLLLDRIKASIAGRIILVSSYLHIFGRVTPNQLQHINGRNPILKYCDSKLYIIIWMKALAKRLPDNVTVNALHPGLVKTSLFRRVYPLLRQGLMHFLNILKFKTPKEGAQTSIYLAVSEDVANISGKYFRECAEAKHSSLADDDNLVDKIWHESILLTN